MRARIYQRPKSATQSGQAGTETWVLAFEGQERERNDPLMGWWGSSNTQGQVRLRFATKAEAVAFAQRNGFDFVAEDPPVAMAIKPKTYAENFRYGRSENWTH
jgi:hypothetical protein